MIFKIHLFIFKVKQSLLKNMTCRTCLLNRKDMSYAVDTLHELMSMSELNQKMY